MVRSVWGEVEHSFETRKLSLLRALTLPGQIGGADKEYIPARAFMESLYLAREPKNPFIWFESRPKKNAMCQLLSKKGSKLKPTLKAQPCQHN